MEILRNIGFDWQIALANFINFLIIFAILKYFVFGPVQKIIDARNAKIADGLDKAQQSEQALLVAEQKADEEIKTAKSQANQIVADAKEVADAQVLHATTQAEQSAAEVLKKADAQIEKNKAQMEKELLEKTAGLVALGVEKILQEDVNETRNADVNKRALDILKNN